MKFREPIGRFSDFFCRTKSLFNFYRPDGENHRHVILSILLIPLFSVCSEAKEIEDFFRQNCASCHTIGGGRLTGPDLKNVSERQDREWLVRFIKDPQAIINSGDPYALKLLEEARQVMMPTLMGMTSVRAEALLDLIEQESQLEKSQFVGIQISDRPFTEADIENGMNLFYGYASFESGSPACISCHSFNGVRGLGGGKLGPDLTKVYERMENRKTLATWLSAPATETMGPISIKYPLNSEEVLSLVALFQNTAQKSENYHSSAVLNFLLFGIGAAVLILVVFEQIWKSRFKAVRKPMVRHEKLPGEYA